MTKRILLIALTLALLLVPSLAAADLVNSPVVAQFIGLSRLINQATTDSFPPDKSGNYEILRSLRMTESEGVRNDKGSDILVLDNSVEIRFPQELVFRLEAQSPTDITDIRLHYQVDKMNYAKITSEGWPTFTPAARIKSSWTWDMRKASLPPGATVIYWWTIEDRAGNRFDTSPNTVQFDDNRYHWQTLTTGSSTESGKLSLFWYEGDNSLAQALLEACEQGLARLVRDIGVYPENSLKIYVYASSNDLQGAMIFPMEWTGGAAFTEFGIIAIGISPGQIDWGKRALVHELTHLIVHQASFSPYGELPAWLDEGLAMNNEGVLNLFQDDPYLQSWLKKAITEDKLISVRSLCSPFSAEAEKAYISYAESYSLVKYLLDNYGQEEMLNLLILFKQGNTYDEALSQVYGFDIEGFDARWRETLTTSDVIATLNQVQGWKSHPALIAVLSALATSLALAGALAIEEWTWQRSNSKS